MTGAGIITATSFAGSGGTVTILLEQMLLQVLLLQHHSMVMDQTQMVLQQQDM